MDTLTTDFNVLSILGPANEYEENHVRFDYESGVLESARESLLDQRELVTTVPVQEPVFWAPPPAGMRVLSAAEMQKIDPQYVPRKPPQRLSAEEIQSLLALAPPIQSVSKQASNMATRQLHKLYTRRMSEANFVLENSPEARERYIDMQQRLIESARSKNGDAMGMKGAFAESSDTTQATMKVKKKVTSTANELKGGLQSIKSLLHAQEFPNEKRMNIHFLQKVSKRQVIDLNSQVVGVSMGSLMVHKNIRIAKLTRNYDEPADSDNLSYNVAHDVYVAAGKGKRNIKYESYCMRIALDKEKLYAHQLTPYKLAAILRAQPEIDRSVRIIPSSFHDAFLDVFTTSETSNVEQQRVDLYYISLEKIRSVIVQGTPEIKRLDPVSVPYHVFFKPPRKAHVYERQELQELNVSGDILEYDLMIMANHNYPSTAFIEDSLRKAGIVIRHKLYTEFAQRLYAYVIAPMRIPLGPAVLEEKLKEAGYEDVFLPLQKEEDQSILAYRNPQDRDYTALEADLQTKIGLRLVDTLYEQGQVVAYRVELPIINNLREALLENEIKDREYVYAVSDGSDMQRMTLYPWVDTARLTTNSIPIMWKYFGIEVARNYFIYDYIANKKAVGAAAQPRYTFIIADDMTFWGKPAGITFHENVKKRDNDFISLSTIGHPNQIYATYASKGSTALITTNPSAITATGEIFGGASMPGILNPRPEAILNKLKAARAGKVITSRNLAQAARQRTEQVLATRTEKFNEPLATRNVVIPTLIATPQIVQTVPVVNRPKEAYAQLAPSYTRSAVTERMLEGLFVPGRGISTEELLAQFIVTKEECLQLLQRKFRLATKVDIFERMLVSAVPETKRRREYNYYIETPLDEEEEEEIIAPERPLVSQEPFRLRAGANVEMVI